MRPNVLSASKWCRGRSIIALPCSRTLTFGRLVLDIDAQPSQLVRLGAFRPIIGSLFGTAITVLVAGDLLPIAGPQELPRQLYFYAGLTFIAGFSERWAQDMLSGTESLSPQPAASPIGPCTEGIVASRFLGRRRAPNFNNLRYGSYYTDSGPAFDAGQLPR